MSFTGRLGNNASTLGSIELGNDSNGGGGGSVFTEGVTDTMSLASTGSYSRAYTKSVVDTISLTQEVSLLNQHLSDALGLTDLASEVHWHHPTVTDTLSLSDSATFMDERQVIVPPDVMMITDHARQNFYNGVATDPLSIVQDVDVRVPHYLQIHHRLFLADAGRNIAKNQRVQQFINLATSVGQERDASASNTISLTQEAYVSHPGSSVLALTQTVVVGKGAVVSHFLADLKQSVSLAGSEWNKTLGDDLNLLQSAAWYINQPCTTRQYSPFITVTDDPVFSPPPVTAPVTSLVKMTLTYPYVSPTQTLVLRNPEFGNKEDFTTEQITRRTMGGTYIAFADPTWPTIKSLKVTSRLLKLVDANSFRTFIRASLGKEIGLLDYENRQWRGIITNPDTAITQDDRVHYTINIEFEGVLA